MRSDLTTPVISLLLLGAVPLGAAEPAFRRHAINADSTYSACASFDVNGDGKLDILCGGYWYEALRWKKHFLREVEAIRGRFDDYSNLPLDVDGDGRLDLVSVNYRSQSLYWVRQPEDLSQPWKRTVIDTPGPAETGRLVDVDGDGRLDVLPNGVRYAAWYELRPGKGDAKSTWIRHNLPKEVAAHGVGFGDINGDGRGDIVSPNGFLEAPQDRRGGRWLWRPEFQLHRDGSIPILVQDVDDDSDADLIWGRGHHTGLYWLEQTQRGDERAWRFHVIDTSWSQPHAILLADMDGDGKDDLVAGKRYMGHDGNDPGEYDPMCIYWYRFEKESQTWRRNLVSYGGGAGFGTDPKAVDIDGDGDLDLIGPGRSGLFLHENLRIDDGASASDPEPAAPIRYADHRAVMSYQDVPRDEYQPVATPAEWAIRRSHILVGMQSAMGRLPTAERRVPLDVKVLEEVAAEGYTRKKITYAAEPGSRVHAYLLIPDKVAGQAPAMLCLHPTHKIGKGVVMGMSERPNRQYAHELAQRGYVCIAPDYPSFGDDADYDFAEDDYESGTMKAIWNNIRAVDLLESLPQVDRDRIGAIGHSLGGHNALFTAPFDLRIRAVVTSCGFTAFHHYYKGDLKGWTSDRYMPRIRDRFDNDPDKVPFDFHEVLAAIAPRPIFINAPQSDANFDVAGVKKVVAEAGKVYDLLGGDGALQAAYPDAEHDFPDAQRKAAYEFLSQRLK